MYYIEGTSLVFPTIQEARLYDFNTNGNINSVRSGTPEGWDGTVSSWDGENLTTVSDSGGAEPTEEAPFTTDTFTFIRGTETGEQAALSTLYGQTTEAEQVTADDLRAYFDSPEGDMLKRGFGGDFDNYLAYMTERERLIQAGEYDSGDWANADAGLSEDDLLLLEGDSDLWTPETEDADYLAQLNQQQISAQQGGYNNWINNEQNVALMEQFGFQPTIMDEKGSTYKWNGTAYTRTEKANTGDMGAQMKLLMGAAMGMVLGPAAAQGLTGGTTGLASATIKGVTNSLVTQLVSTGEINLESLAQAALTGAVGDFISNSLGPLIQENFPDLADLTTGSETFDNVLSAMAQDALGQAVLTGEIDAASVVRSGVFAGAQEALAWFLGEYMTASDEEAQSLWGNTLDDEFTAQQRADLDAALEEQFNATVGDLVNQMGRETAAMVSENLRQLINGMASDGTLSGSAGGNFDDNWYADEGSEAATAVEEAGGYLTPPNQIDNPFEGDELINGVYYNEAGHPVGIHPDATKEQILEQFVNEKNAWTTASGVSAHGIPDDALAILIGDGDLQGLSDYLVANDLILAQEASGAYILISGADNITTGFHSSLDQDALLNLEAPSNTTFLPPPTSNPNLEDMDTSDVSQEVRDLLTNVEEEPQLDWETWQPPETDYTWEDIETTPLDQTEVEELEQFVEDFVTENPDATVADVLAGAQSAGATSASQLAAIASAMTSSAQEAYDALTQSGVSSAEAAAGLVSNGSWTAEEANNATGGGNRTVDDNPETNPPLEGGGYANPTSNTTYQVGDRYFDNIQDARAYDFNTSGTIDNVTNYDPSSDTGGGDTDTGGGDTDTGGGDTDTGGGDTDTGGGDTDTGGGETDTGGGETDTGGGETDTSFDTSELENALQELAAGGDANAQAILDALAASNSSLDDLFESIQSGDAALQDLLGDVGTDTDTILEQLGILGLDTTALLDGQLQASGQLQEVLQGQSDLAETQQNILDALQEAAESGSAEAQQLLEAINNNATSIEDLARALTAGDTLTTEMLGNVLGDTNALLGGQQILGRNQANILQAIQDAAAGGDANAQALLEAINNNSVSLDELAEGMASGNAEILELLGGIGIDTDALLEGQSQLSQTQQDILQAIQNAAAGGDANAQALLEAINNNSVSLDELAEGMASGNAEILELLGGIGIDTDALLEGQSQLSQTQQDILQAIQNAAAGGDANAQALLEAIGNNSTSLEELASGLASGNAEIIGMLEGIGADTDALLGGQQDILQGQEALEQSILDQLQAAADAGNTQAQQMLDAIGGNTDLLGEILESVGAGDSTILGQLGQLGLDVSGLQDGINSLLEGQGDLLEGQEGLSGQLSGTQEAILGALTDGLAEAAAQGNANAQSILDAIASGNSEVISEIMGGVSAGEGNIISMLIDAGVDLDGLQQGINDILAGQGDLSDQMGEGFGGIGDQLGEGFGQLGEGLEGLAAQGRGLGMGLLGGIMALGEGQKKAAKKTTPIWKDFYSAPTPYGAEIFQSKYVGAPQQDNTKQNLDNLIARSLGQGNNKGMLS